MLVYETIEGDQLDLLCYQKYGFIDGAMQKVLAENPGLSRHGEVLPAGIKIKFPRIEAQTRKEQKIWGDS